MNRCIKCVSPDSYPGLSLDDNGCCNHCLDHENAYGNWESTKEERKKFLEQLIEKITICRFLKAAGRTEHMYYILPLKYTI